MLTQRQQAQTALRQERFRQRQQEARRQELAAKGLPALPAIPTMPGRRRWRVAVQTAAALLAQVEEEMTAYYEGRSETWQESDAGVEFLGQQDEVSAVVSQIDELTL